MVAPAAVLENRLNSPTLLPGERSGVLLLTRDQLVERIQRANPSATTLRLAGFDIPALRLYLDHLTVSRMPRWQAEGWVRPGDTAGILTREARD